MRDLYPHILSGVVMRGLGVKLMSFITGVTLSAFGLIVWLARDLSFVVIVTLLVGWLVLLAGGKVKLL